jgi:hypothetical protein
LNLIEFTISVHNGEWKSVQICLDMEEVLRNGGVPRNRFLVRATRIQF